jgi:hypothetical protein
LGATLATCGWGAEVAAFLEIGTLGTGMISAAISTLSAQTAVGLMNHRGNVGRVLKDITSKDALRSLAVSVAAAGLTQAIGTEFGIAKPDVGVLKALSSTEVFMEYLQYNLVNAGVSTTLNATVGGQSLEEAAKCGLKSLAADTLQGIADIHIEAAHDASTLGAVTSTLSHGLSGAAAGAVLDGDPLSGAAGAIAAKTFSRFVDVNALKAEAYEETRQQALATGRPYLEADVNRCFEKKLCFRKEMARLTAAVAALSTGQNVDIAVHTATNAMNTHVWREQIDPPLLPPIMSVEKELSTRQQAYDLLLEAGYSPENAALIVNHPDIQRILDGKLKDQRSASLSLEEPLEQPSTEKSLLNLDVTSYSLDPLSKALMLTEEGALAINQFTDDHPYLAEGGAIALQVALGGPVRMLIDQGVEYTAGDLKRNAQQTIVAMVAEKTALPESFIELTGAVVGFGLSIARGRVKAAIKDAKTVSHAVEKRVHKNSLEYVGDTHIYAIKANNGRILKYGESAAGKNKLGQSNRAQAQVRKLERQTGGEYESKIIKEFPNKANARKAETKYIKTHRKVFGKDSFTIK